jgi:POT family proton-dependent oligopeptide transporter
MSDMAVSERKTFMGHPRGLVVLFFAEMWERFSYYGMRALLIFYLTQHFLFDDGFSQGQYAAYTSLVYLTPLIGGFIADRYLGSRKAVIIGAILLVLGHSGMAIEGMPARQMLEYQTQRYEVTTEGRGGDRQVKIQVGDDSYVLAPGADGGMKLEGMTEDGVLPMQLPKGSYTLSVEGRDPLYVQIFYLSLALIIAGVGFLKANISTVVGQLYEKDDPRRDSGFTLYYMGVNIGAFLASIVCGWLGLTYGWWAGFGAAGLGMILGLIVFLWGQPWLEGRGEPTNPEVLRERVFGPFNREHAIWGGAVLLTLVCWLLVQHQAVMGLLLLGTSTIVLGGLLWFIFQKLEKIERDRMLVALILTSFSTLFWTLFEQAGSSLNQFAERNTDLTAGPLSITAAQTQSFNAGFIVLLAPVFSALWVWLAKRKFEPSTPLKFALALIQVGLGFLILVYGASVAGADARVPLMFLVLAYLLHTTGELCISPVGLSMITKLSVTRVASLMMAVWFLSSSWAQFFAGIVAKMTATETVAGVVLDPAKSLATYAGVFGKIGVVTIIVGIAVIGVAPVLRRMMHGVK